MRDKNGCGESELEVAVIELPKFFSPNNDEENDTMKRMIHGQFEWHERIRACVLMMIEQWY